MKTRNSVNAIMSNFHAFPIRYNSEIEVNNKTIFIKSWYQNGVKTIVTFCKMVDFSIQGMHLLKGFIYHICVQCSIMAYM